MGSKLTDLPDLAPSGDFALNSFLIEINDDLTNDDLQKLKFLCKGKYGIGKARLEKIQKPMELFDILRERDLLNEMNIITLQAMLWALPRRDLQNKYVEFAESLGSSIHFIVPKDIPENGFKHLKFHIRGTDLETYDKAQLENLRSMIGYLLRVPPEFVIISGIEPSNSLVITVMILDDDCQRLCNISPDNLSILSSAYVNGIMVDETFIPISEIAKSNPDHPTNSRMEEEARLALLRHTQAEKELNKAHDKIASLESELTATKRDDHSIFVFLSLLVFLIQQCHDVYSNIMKIKRVVEDSASNPVDKLQKLCVFQIFRHNLRKVREAGYKEDLIYDLLDAHALVFQWHKHESKDIIIADLKRKLAFTTWQKEKLAYYHRLGERDRIMSQSDEFFISALLQNIPIGIEQHVMINTQVSKECVEYALRRLSRDLSESDLRKLSTMIRSPGKRKPFTAVSVFEYLMTSINEQKGVELRTFVKRVLATPLNRMELLQNLERYVLEFHTTQTKPQMNKPCGSKSAKRKTRPTFRGGKQAPLHSTSAASTSTDPQINNFEEINERLSKIEKILERRESNPYPSMTKNSLIEEYEALGRLKQIFPTSFLDGKYNNLNIP